MSGRRRKGRPALVVSGLSNHLSCFRDVMSEIGLRTLRNSASRCGDGVVGVLTQLATGSARTQLRCALARSAPGQDTRSGQGALARRHMTVCAADTLRTYSFSRPESTFGRWNTSAADLLLSRLVSPLDIAFIRRTRVLLLSSINAKYLCGC